MDQFRGPLIYLRDSAALLAFFFFFFPVIRSLPEEEEDEEKVTKVRKGQACVTVREGEPREGSGHFGVSCR